jgi:hypothetical protein
MQTYPHSTAIILNEATFLAYGGQTGTFTSAQLQSAYLAAEMQATQYIGTFLLPTIVTGTYGYAGSNFVVTDYGYVHRILSAKILSIDDETTCTLHTDTGCAYIWDDTFGYLNVSCVLSHCHCDTGLGLFPYQFQIAYEAGLPTGTTTKPTILQALTMAAQIFLNEMAYPSANESTGDVGVESFSNQGYSEKRKTLKRTSFGQSAKSNYIAHLIDSTLIKARRALYF